LPLQLACFKLEYKRFFLFFFKLKEKSFSSQPALDHPQKEVACLSDSSPKNLTDFLAIWPLTAPKNIQLFGFVSFFCSIETIVQVQPTLGKNSGNQSFQPVLRATRDFHNLMAILKSNNIYQTVESPHERCIFVAMDPDPRYRLEQRRKKN
jgi:hypothetical protein